MKLILGQVLALTMFCCTSFAGGSEVTNPWPFETVPSPSAELTQALADAGISSFQTVTSGVPVNVSEIDCTMSSFGVRTDVGCKIIEKNAAKPISVPNRQSAKIYAALQELGAYGRVLNPEYMELAVFNLQCICSLGRSGTALNWGCTFYQYNKSQEGK